MAYLWNPQSSSTNGNHVGTMAWGCWACVFVSLCFSEGTGSYTYARTRVRTQTSTSGASPRILPTSLGRRGLLLAWSTSSRSGWLERETGTSTEITLQAYSSTLGFLMWVLGLELRLSGLSSEHFTHQTVLFFKTCWFR